MFPLSGITYAVTKGVDPYTNDRTPKVTVEINGKEYEFITNYCYDSDILQLGDPCSVVIPNPHAEYTIVPGDSLKLWMADPDVNGGSKVAKLKGVVVSVSQSSDSEKGTIINVGGADLGWHLVNNDVPIWKRLAGRTFGSIFTNFVDSSWGFAGFRAENDTNVRIKLGGNYARATAQLGDTDKPPIVQTEPGDKLADMLIQYAKLANKLVNVSSDGYLQLFSPRYDTPVAYRFYNYRIGDANHTKNNVLSTRFSQALDSKWTKAVCVGSRYIPLVEGVDPNDPNANSFRGTFEASPRPLPFNRLVAFADPDRLNRTQATARAKWKIQRGDFDSWTYEIVVRGHSQDGNFFEADTMCEVHDYVNWIEGKFYISAVRYERSDDRGTTTTLTIKKPNLLAA